MEEAGLWEETKALYPHRQLNALQTVGYQECFAHFADELTKAEATALIQQNSRRYAKRQLTWMRRDGFWKRFRPSEQGDIIPYIKVCMQMTASIHFKKSENFSPTEKWNFQAIEKESKILYWKNQNGIQAITEILIHKKWAWIRQISFSDTISREEQFFFFHELELCLNSLATFISANEKQKLPSSTFPIVQKKADHLPPKLKAAPSSAEREWYQIQLKLSNA